MIAAAGTAAADAAHELLSNRPASRKARWLGDKDLLGRFGLGDDRPALDTLAEALRGKDTKNNSVRVPKDVRDGSTRVTGLVQLRVTLKAPKDVGDRWRNAGKAERDAIEAGLFEGAEATARTFTGTGRIVAAGVFEVGGTRRAPEPQVRLIVVCAETEKGLGSAFVQGRHAVGFTKQAAQAAMGPLTKALAALERPEPEQASPEFGEQQVEQLAAAPTPAAQAPKVEQAVEAPPVNKAVEAAPKVERAAEAPPVAQAPPARVPLTDSLARFYKILGPGVANRIKRDADALRAKEGYGQRTDAELCAQIQASSAFARVSRTIGLSYRTDAEGWSKLVVAHVAAEETRIENAMNEQQMVMDREIARGKLMVDPIPPIQVKMGREFAGKVRRYATVEASRLAAKCTPEELEVRAERNRQEIEEEVPGKRSFFTLVEKVAHKYLKNAQEDAIELANEREARNTPEVSRPEAEIGAGF